MMRIPYSSCPTLSFSSSSPTFHTVQIPSDQMEEKVAATAEAAVEEIFNPAKKQSTIKFVNFFKIFLGNISLCL